MQRMTGRLVVIFAGLGGLALHAEDAALPFTRLEPEGSVQSREVDEASGLAVSPGNKDFLWLLNDSGCSADLHLTGTDGSSRGKVTLKDTKNIDWEDLCSFIYKGKPYLLIADTGDNLSKRPDCFLYIVPEPQLPKAGASLEGTVKAAWTIHFKYEDGPRDCEAVAVDEKAGKILLVSKRTKPPVLYELPLKPKGDGMLTAKKIGEIPKTLSAGMPPIPYGSQPTGLAIAPDGSMAAVVTYFRVFVFPRKAGETWPEAFSHEPVALQPHRLRQAESVSFSRDGEQLGVVSEGEK